MEEALAALQADLATCQTIENSLRGKPLGGPAKARQIKAKAKEPRDVGCAGRGVEEVLVACIEACKQSRKRHREESGPPDDTSDAGLSQYTRFTDRIALDVYKQFLHYAPRLVNVVTVRHHPLPLANTLYPLHDTHSESPWLPSLHSPCGSSIRDWPCCDTCELSLGCDGRTP